MEKFGSMFRNVAHGRSCSGSIHTNLVLGNIEKKLFTI
jgi:hypothetical protein